jgi:hypothetical protein
LLDRLGLYGVRIAISRVRSGTAPTATDLGRALLEVSGLASLRSLLDTHFAARADVLRTRTIALRLLELSDRDPALAAACARDAELLLSGASELAELRFAQLLLAGDLRVDDGEVAEMRRVVAPGSVPERLGVADADQVARAALDGVERWRCRAADPTATNAEAEVFDLTARAYEELYVEVAHTDG